MDWTPPTGGRGIDPMTEDDIRHVLIALEKSVEADTNYGYEILCALARMDNALIARAAKRLEEPCAGAAGY
jgi:hypothetical protein